MIYVHNKKKHISVTIGTAFVIAGALVAYNYFAVHKARADEPLTSDATEVTDSPLSPAQAALLEKIKSIKLDGSIFKDPLFIGLVDTGVKLEPMEVGKSNPFAPISGAPVKAATKTKK